MDIATVARLARMGTQYRQGDILLVAEAELPSDPECLPVPAGPAFALSPPGGPGGHTHSVQGAPGVVAFRARSGQRELDWLEVTGMPVTLTHPEHAPLTLAPGLWRVVRQREYDPVTARRIGHCD